MVDNFILEADSNDEIFTSDTRQSVQLVIGDSEEKKCQKCHWAICFVITLILACVPLSFITGLEMGRNSGNTESYEDLEPVREKLFVADTTSLKMEFDRYYVSNKNAFKIGVLYGRNCNDNIKTDVCSWKTVSETILMNHDRTMDLVDLGQFDLDNDLIMIYFDQIGKNNVDWLTVFELEFTAEIEHMKKKSFDLRGPGLLTLYDYDRLRLLNRNQHS